MLDAVAQPIAHATALFDRFGEVLLKQTTRDAGEIARQASAVQQAVEGREILKALPFDHRLQIEFDISLTAHQGRIAQ